MVDDTPEARARRPAEPARSRIPVQDGTLEDQMTAAEARARGIDVAGHVPGHAVWTLLRSEVLGCRPHGDLRGVELLEIRRSGEWRWQETLEDSRLERPEDVAGERFFARDEVDRIERDLRRHKRRRFWKTALRRIARIGRQGRRADSATRDA